LGGFIPVQSFFEHQVKLSIGAGVGGIAAAGK
jgi:hypothetical protein